MNALQQMCSVIINNICYSEIRDCKKRAVFLIDFDGGFNP